VIAGVPTASSSSVAMRQDSAVRRMYSPSGWAGSAWREIASSASRVAPKSVFG
jgi:hypothetical protein